MYTFEFAIHITDLYDSFRLFKAEYSKIFHKEEILMKSNLNVEDSFVDNSYNS